MSLNQLFKPKFTTGQTIKIVTPSGAMLDSCEVNIGQLTGRFRSLSAILCDGTDDAEPWHVINLVDGSGALLDHIAIQGAVSRDQAKRLCNKYLPQMQNGFIRNVVTITDNALKTFLDGAVLPSNTPYFLENDAMLLDLQGSVQAVEWGEDNRLLSHGGHLSKVMYDMACCDAQDDLLAQVSPRDIVSMLVDETCVFGGMMDAMIIKYRQFDIVMQKVAEALKSYDHEDLFVKSVTPIEPFKRNNVVNVGTIFTMSDSQTITVLFNNPDTTPAKLTADDVLTSWKWMLNKRDVTAVLQPRAVEAKKYPVIAGRIIKLFAKNHDRFKRNQKIREKEELLLNELINQVEAKQSEVRFIDSEILKQQQEIDAETVRKQNQTEIGKAGLTAENAEEFHENLKNTLAQNEQNVQINNDDVSIYEIIGSAGADTVKITKKEDSYDVFLNIGTVGGEFSGKLPLIKNWLVIRLQSFGESINSNQLTWELTALKLKLISGEDFLNLSESFVSFEEINSVNNGIGLAKLISKKLATLDGWTVSGSTAIREVALNGGQVKFKFNYDPLAKGKEFRIDASNEPKPIAFYGAFTPSREEVETSVKSLDQSVNDHIQKVLENASISNKQSVQMNTNEQNEALKTGVVFKKEAEDIWRAIDYSVTDYQGHTANEFKKADVKGRFEPLIIKAEALLTRRFRDEHQKEMTELSIKNAKETIARWEKAQEDVPLTEPQQSQTVAEDGSASQVENPIPESGESTSETEQFLQSVIDGTADMSDQAFSDKLLAVADNLDPSLESLFEQASDAYADYAINLEV
jgi:hypothetical protein